MTKVYKKYINKYYYTFFNLYDSVKSVDKLSEYFKNNKFAITHKSFKSPWNWQYNAKFYLKVSENKLFMFESKWSSNKDSIIKRFNECCKLKSPKKRNEYMTKKVYDYTHYSCVLYLNKESNQFE